MRKLIIILILIPFIGNSQIVLKPNRSAHWETGGSELGSELVSNGDFASGATGWTTFGSGTTFTGGNASMAVTSYSGFYQAIDINLNDEYRITFDVSNYSSGTLGVLFGDLSNYDMIDNTITSNGSYSFDVTYDNSSIQYERITFYGNGSFTGDIDNVSIKKIL